MACPHVAGVSAILMAYNETISYEGLKSHLFNGADTQLQFSGRVCQGVIDSVFPNHVFGYGRVNALNSLMRMIGKSY